MRGREGIDITFDSAKIVDRKMTRATIEVHHSFSEVSSIWEITTTLRQKLIWRKIKLFTVG